MKVPVAIIGGGPGGSALALYLAREGIESVIIEKEAFPRYHIGESMTGEAGNIMRTLGLAEKMLAQRHPVKWGVHVFGRRTPWFVPVMMRTPEGGLKETYTWQVRRSEFDKMMLDEATAAGATLLPGRALTPIVADDGTARGLRVKMADGGVQDIESEVVVDASGQARWLSNVGLTSKLKIGYYDRQVAIFSQVRGAIRAEDRHAGDTLIFYNKLVHWAWFIPIDDEVTSVGVVSPARYYASKKESKRDFLIRELHELNPHLKTRIPEIHLVEDVRAIQNYSYQIDQFTGKGWMCLGDAHRFIDPIFSFGLYVALKEAGIAAPAIKAYLGGAHRDQADPFAAHRDFCERGLDKVQDLIDAFWCNPLAFAFVAHEKHREGTIDLFAGRVHADDPNSALNAMRDITQNGRRWWENHTNWWDQPV